MFIFNGIFSELGFMRLLLIANFPVFTQLYEALRRAKAVFNMAKSSV